MIIRRLSAVFASLLLLGVISQGLLVQSASAVTPATYAAPTVTGVSPSSGSSGNTITVTGTGFQTSVGVIIVDFVVNGTTVAEVGPNSPIAVSSNTQLTVPAPAGVYGLSDIRVGTSPSGGGPAQRSPINPSDEFTFPAAPTPTITGVSPAFGSTDGNTQVTITGTNFPTNYAYITGATIGGTNLQGVGLVSSTEITGTTQPGTGVADTTLTLYGTTYTDAASFTYVTPPVITTVSPSAGPEAGGNTVTITGTNLTGVTAINFGTTAGAITAGSSTSITATAPAGTGTVDVTLVAAHGVTSTVSSADQYTYTPAPTVSALSPPTGTTAGGTLVSVTGTGFTGATAVNFGSTPGTNVNVLSDTQLTVDSPASDVAGISQVTVVAPGGTSVTGFTSRYVYADAPAITSTDATTFTVGTAGSFTVTTTGAPVPLVTETGALPAGVSLDTSGTLSGTPASGTDGSYPIVITADNGVGTAATQDFTLTVEPAPVNQTQGYLLVGSDGGIFNYGSAGYYGSEGGQHLNKPIVGLAATPDGKGYWMVASDGGVFSFGDAAFHGSTGGITLNQPIVGMATTPDGGGYWLVASDGGVFAFGDAQFHGSTGGISLTKPVVGIASTPSGNGYWLVASDGGVFSFGDAAFHGSTGNISLTKPVVGITATPSGNGYWLVASDGGVFSFGDAAFHGSTGNISLTKPVVGIVATPSGNGYWLTAADGGVFNFGDATFQGSAGALSLSAPVVGIAQTQHLT